MAEDAQLTFEDDPIFRQYKDTFQLIRQGHFRQAYITLDELLKQDVDLPIIYTTMKCLKFWMNREEELDDFSKGSQKADFLTHEWDQFENFLIKRSLKASRVIPLIKEAVYEQIIDNHIHTFQNLQTSDAELLIKIAESLLSIENYKKAKDTLLYAKRFKKRDSKIIVYLGECYHFLGEQSKALVYYKDAFFIKPKDIPLENLKNPIITNLVKKLTERGFIGMEINLWLPVYAEIDNVFSSKKKLEEREIALLQKQIYKYEIQFEINIKQRGEIEPRLINYYINLMDQLQSMPREEERLQIKNILRKLKNLNEAVYLKLKKHYE